MSVFGGMQVAVIVLGVIRNKFVAIWLGPAGVALNAIFVSTQDLILAALGLNLRTGGVREISATSPDRRPLIARSLLRISLLLAAAAGVVTLLSSPLLSYFSTGTESHWWWFALLSLGVSAAIWCEANLGIVQAVGSMRSLAVATLASNLIGTAIAIPLYYLIGLQAVLPVYLIIGFLMAAWAAGMRRRVYPMPPARLKLKEALRTAAPTLRLGGFLTLAAVAERLGSYLFVIYMNREASEVALGIYQAGFTVVGSYIGIIFTAISTEYYPRLASVSHSKLRLRAFVGQEFKISAWVLTLVVIVFISADELVVRLLYSSDFMPMLPFISIAICGVIIRAFSVCVAYVILARGDGRTFVVTETVGVAIALVLKIAGYRLWGFTGLGVAYIMDQVLYSLLVWVVYRRRYGLTTSRGMFPLLAASTALALAALAAKAAWGWWAPLLLLPPVAAAAWHYIGPNIRPRSSVKI
ncbi:MAG: oligosaccharide flippase family protein [Muribaculaceae bacterium]|nr:oligosaccharide flippase family protein [Muribaculaceae bacterium]